MLFEVGPFVIKIGYDKTLDTYYGHVHDGSIENMSKSPFLTVGSTYQEITDTRTLQEALQDDAFQYGNEISSLWLNELEQRRFRSRKPNVALGTETH